MSSSRFMKTDENVLPLIMGRANVLPLIMGRANVLQLIMGRANVLPHFMEWQMSYCTLWIGQMSEADVISRLSAIRPLSGRFRM